MRRVSEREPRADAKGDPDEPHRSAVTTVTRPSATTTRTRTRT
eukprot:CAMPEP_0185206904 /NCGR_PEP_ID=MMETSP1140-20130426/59294_1 /TAXON_ID=298111 /ORGANISM="Pavlova sp., Strain CCMP459" /LENGTH=42 /DNA_ID= /DNA_START= /DNA_END= /DNA_ORIENTATION=